MSEVPLQRAVAVVDDAAVERNCRRLADELADGVRLCAVVKADGYGHGAVECARAALAGGAQLAGSSRCGRGGRAARATWRTLPS